MFVTDTSLYMTYLLPVPDTSLHHHPPCILLQIPRYIITLHELLAHTPHDHVERNSLEYAKSKLEELSKVRASVVGPRSTSF